MFKRIKNVCWKGSICHYGLSTFYFYLVLSFHQKTRSITHCSTSGLILLKYIRKAVGESEQPQMFWAAGTPHGTYLSI